MENESLRVKRLEERLSVLQSAKVPIIPYESFEELELPNSSMEEGDANNAEAHGTSKLEGLDVKELNVVQRRKVMLLKSKRERLDKERERLMG